LSFIGLSLISQRENNSAAQTLSGCPVQAADNIGWKKTATGITIKYGVGGNFDQLHDKARTRIREAFHQWTVASQSLCIKVNFVETVATKTSDDRDIAVVIDYTRTTTTELEIDPLTKQVIGANILFNPNEFDSMGPAYEMVFLKFGLHEIGHTFGLDHPVFQIVGNSVLNQGSGINDSNNKTAASIQLCDRQSVNKNPQCATPTPTPTPTPIVYYPPPEGYYYPIDNFSGGSCPMGFASDAEGGYCCQGNDCREMEQQCLSQGGYWGGCADGCYSPIVIDILGNGYNLTDGENGIEFDLTGKGSKHKVSWTSVKSDDAWLVLDRNENGRIDSGLELFGNFTVQDSSISVKDRNGFLALAVFDKPENGGNRDGVINKSDTIFTGLQLWQDMNHNGISESNELHTLPSLDIETLELDYRESRRTDEHGNRFKYRAKVWDANKAKVGRWAWDVFLLKGN